MDIAHTVSSIKQALADNSDEKAIGAVRKFVPTSQHVYGVRVPFLNQIAKERRAQQQLIIVNQGGTVTQKAGSHLFVIALAKRQDHISGVIRKSEPWE